MGEITQGQAWGWVLAAAGGIYSIAKAWEVIEKHLRKHSDGNLKDELADHRRRLQELEEGQQELKRQSSQMCHSILAQMNHELSGNDVEMLRKSRDELQDFLAGI